MLNTIARPFGILLLWLYDFLGNYGLALIAFAIIVRLILLPFMIKSKKSTLKTTKLQPRINELQKKYASNQQKLNEEMQKLYRQEGVKPLGGCIWSIIPLPILLALYRAIIYPLTVMMHIPESALAEGGALTARLAEVGFQAAEKARYLQIDQTVFISNNFSQFDGVVENLRQIDFSFLGMDLGATPAWDYLWTTNWHDPKIWVPGLMLFLLPFLNGILTYLSSKVSMKLTEQAGGSQQLQQMKSMNIMMPLITIWFAFIMPSALGLYWIVGIVFTLVQDLIMNKILGKQLEIEMAEFMAREHAREAELEAKRAETERLRAENATVQNKNTSKNKQRALDKQERAEKTAEWERTHASGTSKSRKPSSQVGDRPFARGRAYVAERYGQDGIPADTSDEEQTETLPETEPVSDAAETVSTAPADTEEVTFEEEEPSDFYGEDEPGDGNDQGDA